MQQNLSRLKMWRMVTVLAGVSVLISCVLSHIGSDSSHKPLKYALSSPTGRPLLKLRGGGLLVTGKPLDWDDSLQLIPYVREHGVLQFIHTFNANKNRSGEKLLFGEELEYNIMKLDHANKTVKLSLRGAEVLQELIEKEERHGRSDNRKEACSWHPEYGSWMVEGTPRMPFGGFIRDLKRVEQSMRLRRRRLLSALRPGEIAPTVTAFPLMGTPESTDPPTFPGDVEPKVSESIYCSDKLINSHPRFATLTRNIRKRRGGKVDIKVPMFVDVNTFANTPTTEDDLEPVKVSGMEWWVPRREVIDMDCMAFGMGMCCLQVTFQARDIAESRHLYDQLAVLTPIMLALSAATPILHGFLADTDVRWATIAASVDDRTPLERGLEVCAPSHKGQMVWMAGGGARLLPKSRYESISSYICDCKKGKDPKSNTEKYSDIPCPIDEASFQTLVSAGIDKPLARHIAHLFVRDPLVIFQDRVHISDTTMTDHFENIQSTNWQTCRWKPPPPGSDIGWRVEFRSMEVQLTDFENAAFTVMTVLISRVLLAFQLNLYVPLSKVDENMARAHRRNAAVEGKFWFRKHMAAPEEEEELPAGAVGGGGGGSSAAAAPAAGGGVEGDPDGNEEMTIYEILTGRGAHFPGLLPLVFAYLDQIGCDTSTREVIRRYANILERRAKGDLLTPAAWMRRFVRAHPAYAGDSRVPPAVAYDLMRAAADIGEGRRPAPELHGRYRIEPVTADGAYEVPLESRPFEYARRDRLIAKYASRALQDKEAGTAVSDGWRTPLASRYHLGADGVTLDELPAAAGGRPRSQSCGVGVSSSAAAAVPAAAAGVWAGGAVAAAAVPAAAVPAAVPAAAAAGVKAGGAVATGLEAGIAGTKAGGGVGVTAATVNFGGGGGGCCAGGCCGFG